MADTDPPVDLGDDCSIDLEIIKSDEDSKDFDEHAKKIEDLDLFEEEEKFKNEENTKEKVIKTEDENTINVIPKDSKLSNNESANLKMTNIALENSIEEDPLMNLTPTPSSLPPQLPCNSELVEEVNRLSLDEPVPPAESSFELKETMDTFWIHISISEPRKVDEGVNAYIVYKICTQTNLPSFHQHNADVHRRFSDFLGLHSRLFEKYAREGRIIPQAPEKSILGMAKVKVSKNDSSHEFLEFRRAQLERFLKHLSLNPVLRSDPIFVDFLETEGDLERATHTSTLSGASVKRLFSKVGDGFNRVALRVEETDPWFESRMESLNENEAGLRGLMSSVESVIGHRRECATDMDLLSQDILMLSTVEEDSSTSKLLTQVAELWTGLRDSHGVQADDDSINLHAFVKDCLCMLHSSKDAMGERMKVYKAMKDSEALLTRRKEQLVKLQMHSKTDRNLPAEIAQCEAVVEKCDEDFERVSGNFKQESHRLARLRRRDYKDTLVSSLESSLANQQRTLKLWESFLEDTKQCSNS